MPNKPLVTMGEDGVTWVVVPFDDALFACSNGAEVQYIPRRYTHETWRTPAGADVEYLAKPTTRQFYGWYSKNLYWRVRTE